MKTQKNKSSAIKIIQIIIEIFSLQINFLFAANPIQSAPANQFSTCVICGNSASSTQKDILFNELLTLAPTTPEEATFSEETASPEINLAPTTPESAVFDNDPEFISPFVPECLAPRTPAEAGFND